MAKLTLDKEQFIDSCTSDIMADNEETQSRMLNIERESSDFLNYTCPMCKDRGFEVINCLNCRMEDEDTDRSRVVGFGPTEVSIFYPKEPVNYGELVFESDPMPRDREATLLDLANPGDGTFCTVSHEDLRLAQIIEDYMNQPPVIPKKSAASRAITLSKQSIDALMSKVMPRRNPYKGLTHFQLCSVLQDIYFEGIQKDPTVVDDPFERNLCILRDTDNFGKLTARTKRNQVLQSLRMRVIDDRIRYLAVTYVEAAFKKLEAMTEFESQGLFDSLNVSHNVEISDELNERLDRVSEKLEAAMASFGAAMDQTTEAAKQVSDLMRVLPHVLLFLFCAIMCAQGNRKIWGPLLVACGTWSVWSYEAEISARIGAYIDQIVVAEDSTFESQVNHENPIIGLALLLTSLATVGEAPKGKRSATFLKGIGEIPKLTDGLTCVTAFLIDLVVKCVNEVKAFVQGADTEEWIVKTQPEIDDWCVKVRMVAADFHDGKLAMTLTNRDRARALELQGARLGSMTFPGVEGIRVKNALASYGRLLKKVVDAFDGISPKKQAVRQEPYVITFAGAPGVGKSWIVSMMIADVLSRILPEEDLAEFEKNESLFMYNRFFEEEYFTNYCNEFVTVIDDFMQSRDVLGQPAEPLEFIRMVNSAPYTLHMADLASKGKVHFNSKMIVVNTNQKAFEVNSLVSKEALLRRMDCVIHVCPRREYCTPETQDACDPWDRVFDRNHPSLKKDGVQTFSKDVYELIRVRYPDLRRHPDQFVEVGRYNYDELVEVICSEYEKKEQVADNFMKDMKTRIHEAVANRFGADYEPQVGGPSNHFTSDLTLEDLDEEEPKVEWTVTPRQLLPDHRYLWITRTMDELVQFFASRYPVVWRAFTSEDPVLYALNRIDAEDYADFADLIVRVCAKEERAKQMAIAVYDWYIGVELEEEKQWYSTIVNYFKDVKTLFEMQLEKYPMLKKVLKITAVLGLVAATCYGISKMFKSIEGDEFTNESHPKTRGGGARKSAQNRGVQRHGPAEFVSEYAPEAGGDQNNYELCKKLVEKSLYCLSRNGIKYGNAFVYSGRKCLIPYHYVTMLKNMIEEGDLDREDEMNLMGYQNGVNMPLRVREVISARRTPALVEKDLCVFILPTHFHSHPNLMPHFVSRQLLEKKLDYDCTLTVPNSTHYYRERTHVVHFDVKAVKNDIADYDVYDVFSYKAKTERGDCGSILTIDDPSVTTKILGMHVAGTRTTGMGLSVALCREDFEDVDKAFLAAGIRCFPAPSEVIEHESQSGNAPAPGAFHPYFTLEKRIYGSVETKLRKSLMYGSLSTVLTQPAPLRPFKMNGEWIDPRKNAVARYGAPCVGQCTEQSISLCTDTLFSHILGSSNMAVRNKPQIFSFEIAVLGQPGVKFCDAIPRNTSAGYPYVTKPVAGYHHKEWYFGKGEEYDLDRPACLELKKEALTTIENAKLGHRGFHPYVDTLKDETISHAKAAIGKTRLVSACPLLLTVVTRMLFMDFSMFIMENRINCYAGVGMNPYSEEWHLLALRLKSKGSKVIAGDFSGYDSRQLSSILMAVCDMINRWYDDGEENKLARLTVFQEVVNSIHISGDTVYQWSSKLPSGHPLTTILNSMQAVVLLLLCWVDLNPNGEAGLEDFWQHVYPVTYGDDNIFNISDECAVFFNLQTITASMLKWNQVYTDESKNVDAVHPYKTLEECTFLKRGFRYDERLRRYVAPLALESILDMLNWYSESPERVNTQITNVDNALKELSLHDRDTFGFWSEKIIRSARDNLGYVPPTVNYTALQNVVVLKELAW